MFSTERRGQVGIGTLIVFIAMVLVAAIAAGVLINTAGLLQAQAQQTGEETTAEVSNVIQIGSVVAKDTGSGNGKLDQINASIRLASGADPINVSKASYTLATAGNASVISGNPDESDVLDSITEKQGDVDNKIIADQEDLVIVSFDLSAGSSNLQPLKANQELEIIAQAPAGGNTYRSLTAPRRIKDGESYIL
ncbi:flagellin [Halonotius sp. F2-221B]